MLIRYILQIVSLTALVTNFGVTQETLQARPAAVTEPEKTIALTVPKGATLEIALNENVRVKKAGQEIHGRPAASELTNTRIPVHTYSRLGTSVS